jgi:PhoH-like ATPase
MNQQDNPIRKLFVLDTNVLMHDPSALFRFQEHHLFIPMMVLEELDAAKKGVSELARNVRQVSRFLDELMQSVSKEQIDSGIELGSSPRMALIDKSCSGRLFFQTHHMKSLLPDSLPGSKPDNSILETALTLIEERPSTDVVLISKDINLRIKATVLGIQSEDYRTDKVLDDIDLLYSGAQKLPDDFWEVHGDNIESWQKNGRTFYRIQSSLVSHWSPNEFLYMTGTGKKSFEAIVRTLEGDAAVIELLQDFRSSLHDVWGINARNREQNFALNILMDPEIDFVSILGTAGTGKTLLTLAAGLAQTLDDKLYTEIIMTRETTPVGEDIGFLPGTEEEKMAPWMGALIDNLEFLTKPSEGTEWERSATNTLISNRIKIRSLNFMRGRTFLKRYLIIDESQNLTSKQMKTLITRAGPETKIVCLGNIAQIDTPYLTGTTSGLTYVVDHFKGWEHSAHITLQRGERSRLADYASDNL